jgi:hypothetical protein
MWCKGGVAKSRSSPSLTEIYQQIEKIDTEDGFAVNIALSL